VFFRLARVWLLFALALAAGGCSPVVRPAPKAISTVPIDPDRGVGAKAQPRETPKPRCTELALASGGVSPISALHVKEFTAGNPEVLSIAVTGDGKTLVLTGKKPGMSGLLLVKNDGTTDCFEVWVSR